MTAALPAPLRYELSRPLRSRRLTGAILALLGAVWASGLLPFWSVVEMMAVVCLAIGSNGLTADGYLRSRPIDREAELRAKLASVALRGAGLGVSITILRAAETWIGPTESSPAFCMALGASTGVASFLTIMLGALARATSMVDRAVPFGLDRAVPALAGLRDLVALGVFVAGVGWFHVQEFEDPVAAWSALVLGLSAGGFVLAVWYAPTRGAWAKEDWAAEATPDAAADAPS